MKRSRTLNGSLAKRTETTYKETRQCLEYVISIIRKGSPKYKGGIGLHTTGISKRRFLPNLHSVRVSDGKGNTKRMCLCAKCIKSGKVTKA